MTEKPTFLDIPPCFCHATRAPLQRKKGVRMSIDAIQRAEGDTRVFAEQALAIALGRNVDSTQKGSAPVSAMEFLRHLPPDILAASLEDRPEQQEKIIQGVFFEPRPFERGIVTTMSPGLFRLIVNGAVEDGHVTPYRICSALSVEEWVDTVSKYLICDVILQRKYHDKWWLKKENAAAFIAMLDLFDKFVSPEEKMKWLTKEELVKHLPREQLQAIVTVGIILDENEGTSLKPQFVFQVANNTVLVKCMEASYLWDKLVYPLLDKLGLILKVSEEPDATTLDLDDEESTEDPTATMGQSDDEESDKTPSADDEDLEDPNVSVSDEGGPTQADAGDGPEEVEVRRGSTSSSEPRTGSAGSDPDDTD